MPLYSGALLHAIYDFGMCLSSNLYQSRGKLTELINPFIKSHGPVSIDINISDFKAPIIPMPAEICIVGTGYVGAHLIQAFSKKYRVVGYDISAKSIAKAAAKFKDSENVQLSSDPQSLAGAALYLISVPTLLKSDKSIDTSHIESAIETVTSYASSGSGIVIESSVSVGMTRSLLCDYSSKFHVGFSPERVDPGRDFAIENIPKILSAVNDIALSYLSQYYGSVFSKTIRVSSLETAEFCKLYENCFRMINIAYVQEISDACILQGIDPHEVIKAAATKPFGFMPFYPAVGVGGHCIPINPYYLFENNHLPLLRVATEHSVNRPREKACKFAKVYSHVKRVVVVGIGFKPGQAETSCSPGLAFACELKRKGLEVSLYDPLVDDSNSACSSFQVLSAHIWNSADELELNYDAVFVAMKQYGINWDHLDSVSIPVVFGDRF